MLKVAPLANRLGAPGPQVMWIIPVAILLAMGLVTLFAFDPYLTALALVGAGTKILVKYPKAFLVLFPIYVGFGAATFALAAKVYDRQIYCGWHTFHSCQYVRGSQPHEIAVWFNISDVGDFGSLEVAPVSKRLASYKGHILIRSPRFERKIGKKGELRCDERCRVLLGQPAVQSVTVEVETDLWNQGPRALMAFFRPQSRTFEVRHTVECRDAIEGKLAPFSRGAEGTKLRHAARLGHQCMQSYSAQKAIAYDAVLSDSDFTL